MAAAAASALDEVLPLLPNVHRLVKRTAKILQEYGYKFGAPVQTNMIILDLEAVSIPPAAFVDYCKHANILVIPSGRLVFHFQTSEEAVSRLLIALKQLIEDRVAGKELNEREVHGGYM